MTQRSHPPHSVCHKCFNTNESRSIFNVFLDFLDLSFSFWTHAELTSQRVTATIDSQKTPANIVAREKTCSRGFPLNATSCWTLRVFDKSEAVSEGRANTWQVVRLTCGLFQCARYIKWSIQNKGWTALNISMEFTERRTSWKVTIWFQSTRILGRNSVVQTTANPTSQWMPYHQKIYSQTFSVTTSEPVQTVCVCVD